MKTGIPALLCAAAIVLGSVSASMAAPMALDVTDGGKKMMGDPAHGKEIFNRCMVCHTIQPGVNHIGPSLHGVVGRKAGSIPGFAYSNANKKSGIVWTEQKIYDYLKNPQAMVPGTKMTFPGLPSPQDRADVVSYLKQNSP
jgi:cytochrome c